MSSPVASLVRNTVYVLLSQNVVRAINFFQVVLLTRYLGTTGYGEYSTAQAFPGMFMVLTDLGINSILVRRVARNPEEKASFLSQVLFIKSVLLVVFLAVVSATVRLSRYDEALKPLLMLSAVGYGASMFSEVVTAASRASENFKFESVLNIARGVLVLVFVLAALLSNLGLPAVVAGFALANLLVSAGSMLYIRRLVVGEMRILPVAKVVAIVKESFPFAMHNIIGPFYGTLDVILLSALSTMEAVGVYSAGARIIVFLQVLPLAVNRAAFPRLARLFVASREGFFRQSNQTTRFLLALGAAVSVGLALVADRVVNLLFSSQFEDTATTLRIQALALVFYYLRQNFSTALYTSNRERLAITLFGIGACANAGFDWILIPRYHAVGAACGSLLAEITLCSLYFGAARLRVGAVGIDGKGTRIVLAAVLMGGVAWCGHRLPLAAQVSLAAVCYGVALLGLGVFTREERAMFTRILPWRKRVSAGHPAAAGSSPAMSDGDEMDGSDRR